MQPLLPRIGSIKYFESVFVSLRYPACDILSSVACPVLQYFYNLSDKRHHFREGGVIEHKMCFDFIYNFRLKRLSL